MDKKFIYQYLTAIGLLCSGVLLSFLGFYEEPVGEISQSVQWYFGECLIWAGSLFGMTTYVDWRAAHALREKAPSDEEAHAPGEQPDKEPAHALGEKAPSEQDEGGQANE